VNPYRILRAPLFGLPAETAHRAGVAALCITLSSPAVRSAARRLLHLHAPELGVRRWGIDFPNPVGLAAGFDKSGSAFNALGALGFGFIEIGTITAEPQPGNPVPRVFRLPADRALLNRMGFNNPGAAGVAERLASTPIEPVLGINLGKSRVTPVERATEDYLRSLDLLLPHARYVVINVSSPNTPGLRGLQDPGPLRELIAAVTARARADRGDADAAPHRPILVKLAPDLSDAQLEEAVGIAIDAGAGGIVAVNTTVSRDNLATPRARVDALGAGGISGAPLARRARDVVSRIWSMTSGSVPIVGVGGIFSGSDAWRLIRAGASLVQLYTGFVYEGPALPRMINAEILRRMRSEGISSLDEIVGVDHG
jgi:dihydroorotate dehydrogenase